MPDENHEFEAAAPPPERSAGDVTRVLRSGPPRSALDEVLPFVYEELRELAQRTLRHERQTLTLQPTALVHEAYLKLRNERNGWNDRQHFLIAASAAMRRALVDSIRRRKALKRGGGASRSLDPYPLWIEDRQFEVLALDEVLEQLQREEPEAATLAELRIYGGLSTPECAEALGIGAKTAQRRWRFARAWLVRRLDDRDDLRTP